jgi:hypothetical protein
MKGSSESRIPSTLSEAVQHKLNLYALAASAAGVGILATAQPAEARIIYTKTHRVISPNTHYDLDLNHDGVTDFTLSAFYSTQKFGSDSISIYGGLLAIIPVNNGVWGYFLSGGKWGGNFASALHAGTKVQAGKKFRSHDAALIRSTSFASRGFYEGGQWFHVKNRYLGLRFKISGQTHYGWARLNVKEVDNHKFTGLLTGYAYETIRGKGIIAGKTKGLDVITV